MGEDKKKPIDKTPVPLSNKPCPNKSMAVDQILKKIKKAQKK